MTSAPTLDELRSGFLAPPSDARTMMRWWWFGPRVERSDLIRDLTAMHDAGFGGVELSVVYPLSEETDRYLSPSFLADVRFAADAARERGLRFDLTLGSGWSFGGPHIDATTAARRLWWDRRDIGMDPVRLPLPGLWPGDEFVAAYVGDGSLQEPPTSFTLLDSSDGVIRIPRGNGPRLLLISTARLTGQQVKRAAAGSEGFVLDHYSAAATHAHIDAVCAPLLTAVPAELLGSVFCDSLEAYAADWTPGLLDVFRERRGYDPLPSLHQLHTAGADGATLRADYYRTLTELYEENFVQPLQRWAQGHGVPFRIQGYGEPPAGVSSYRFADAFEGEGWGWRELTQTRWATSAASLYGKRVVSSEIWTWIHSPSLRATPLDLRGEAHEHLLAGINQFIGHGWPSSPAGVEGLGWVFYAAGTLDDRNPWWPAMPRLTAYLHRLSWLMRQGDRVAEVGLYAADRDAYATMHSGDPSSVNLWRATKDLIGDAIPAAIREGGYDYDIWDDDAVRLAVERFAVIVLPCSAHLPVETERVLVDYLDGGGTVIAVGEAPAGLGGANVVRDERELIGVLDAVLAADAITEPASPDVGIGHRRVGDADVYFVANTGDTAARTALRVRRPYQRVERWDAETGTTTVVAAEDAIAVALEPYEAAVFVASRGGGPQDERRSTPAGEADAGRPVPTWSARFAGEETERVVAIPHRWEDERPGYSGTVVYTSTLTLADGDPLLDAEDAVIDFGETSPLEAGAHSEMGIRGRSFRVGITPPVGEIAEVRVNGEEIGVVWGTPYRLALGGILRSGDNTIEVRVSNTAGNALAHDPSVLADAERSTRWFGRRFRMQNLELAAERTASGMLRVPVLRRTPERGR